MTDHSGNPMHDRDVLNTLMFSNPFRAPVVKSDVLDYMASFEEAIQTVESGELVHALHLARLEMELKLNTKPLDWKEVMQSIDRYLPLLFSMTWSLTQQAGLVKLNQRTLFEWKGSFSVEAGTSKREEFAFELIMTLHTLAMSHVAQARTHLDEGNRDFAAAGKSYLVASNILDYLGSNLLSRWKFTGIRPPEAQETVCLAFSHYYQACAQKLAILKAITKSENTLSTPSGTLAKLCVTVANLCQQSLSLFERLSLENLNKVNPLFLTEIRYSLEIYMAMTCYFEGKAQLLKDQCGIAIAYFRQAKNGLKEQKLSSSSTSSSNHLFNPFQSGLPKLIDSYISTSAGIRKMLLEILHVCEVAERDNNLIYFQPIPEPNDMPPLPDNALIMTKTMYVEPRSGDFVKFQYPVVTNEDKSTEGSMDTTINNNTAAATEASLLESNAASITNNNDESNKVSRSDSEYARELQRKIDAGEDC